MDINVEVVEIHNGISQVHVLRDYDKDNINEWLLMGTNDPGYNILLDDKIVYNLIDEDNTERKENKTDNDLTVGEYGQPHSKAIDALVRHSNSLRDKTNQTPLNCYNKEIKELSCSKEKINNRAK